MSLGRPLGTPLGRSIGAFRTRVDAQADPMTQQVAELEGSALARLSSPSTGPERVEQQAPRYEAASAAADALGYEEVGQQGPVSSLFDFLMRGQSATMGAITGLAGMERSGDEQTRGGINESLRRFGQGLTGQEQYRFADFTETGRRVAEGEEVGGARRGWNTALGFVIDTATDPITYLSFGGSIMGRMRAANVVKETTRGTVRGGATTSAPRAALERGVGSSNFNSSRFAREAIDSGATRTDKLVFDLNRKLESIAAGNASFKNAMTNVNFPTTSSVDDIVALNKSIFERTGIDIVRESALDIAPDIAAMAYAKRSSAGLRRWANNTFGKDVGEEYFRALPRDIQGGLRIRLPFARQADGTPIAYGVEGVGAGRLGDVSPTIRKIEDLTQSGRDMFRELAEPVLGKISGKSGAIYYDAVIAATGRKIRTSKGTDGSTWVDYSFSNIADAKNRELRTMFDEKFVKQNEYTSGLYRNAEDTYGESFKKPFVKYMYNTEELDAAYAIRSSFSEAEQAAINTAHSWRQMLDELGNDALEVFEEAGMAFNFLTNYVPRIMNQRAIADARVAGRRGKAGARPGYTKHREQWGAQWKISSDGTAYVIRWMPNEEIASINPNVFETDPTVWMAVYLAELRTSLNDQKIINLLRRNGMLTAAQLERYADINEAELQRRAVQFLGSEETAGRHTTVRKVDDLLQRYAGRSGTDFEAMADELGDLGATILRRGDFDNYTEVDGAFQNVIDGTIIRQVKDGRWQVFDANNAPIRHNQRYVFDPDKGSFNLARIGDPDVDSPLLIFDEYHLAKRNWDQYQELSREAYWSRAYLPDEFDKLAREISDMNHNELFTIDRIEQFTRLSDLEKADFVEGWMNALKRFDLDGYNLVMTRSGMPSFAKGVGNRPIVTEQTKIAPRFAEWLGQGGYMDVQGVRIGPDGAPTLESQIIIKQRIAEGLVNDYAPKKFMQSIQRMFESTQAPQTTGAKLYNDFYKPLYAAQKAWMTLGRGPGFVVRNVLGGSWNNYINAVGREHTIKSAAIVRATRLGQADAAEIIKKRGLAFDPSEYGEIYRDAVKKRLSSSYSGQELDDLMEAWFLFSKNGLAGNRETARLYGELYRNVQGRQEGARFRIRQQEGASGRFEAILDEDMSGIERALEMAAGDNWWIRDFMAPKVEISEDYMRFAAFLKGIDEVGLEPDAFVRGYAASQIVKTAQFDYADLSDAEKALKMLVPFYTWTRYNVPLQIRAVIHEPGKVAQALRVHESLGAMFGDDEDNLSPSYVADRFGITIPEANGLFEMLPEWMRPRGDVTLGLTWGEPLADINTLFRDPFYAAQVGGGRGLASGGLLNWRELAQQLNPIIAATSAAQQAIGEAGRMDGRNVEEAPRWARALGLAREDPTEPGTFISNRSLLEAIRSTVPVAGQLERVVPYLGGERHEGRWTTSVVSALFGLPVATIDDWKRASEMDRRATFVQQQMKAEFGPSWSYRNELITRLVREGAPSDFIASLNLRDFKDDEVDVLRAVHTWRMLRRVELLIEAGTPEDEIVAALSAFAPEGSKVEDLVKLLWNYVPKPPGDFETGVRQFGLQPITRKDLEELGLTTNDVRNLSEDEQRNLVYWVNRNKGWTGPQS